MQRKILSTIALGSFALVVGLGAAGQAQTQDVKAPYPNMAPLDRYLMERNTEIALVRSAAPESISRDAEVRVLGRHGYETAVKGKNGFVCLVERSWMSPFDFPEFWNPKMRGPICFNPPAVRSILPLTFKRTELVLAGLSKSQIIDGIKAFDVKELPALEPSAMCYMMSKEGYLNDSAGHWVPHLMFYVPLTDPKSWGADLPGSPVMLNPQFQGAPEPITEFMVLVPNWSDGTAARKEAHRRPMSHGALKNPHNPRLVACRCATLTLVCQLGAIIFAAGEQAPSISGLVNSRKQAIVLTIRTSWFQVLGE